MKISKFYISKKTQKLKDKIENNDNNQKFNKKYLIIGTISLLIIIGIIILFTLLFGCKKKTIAKPSYLVTTTDEKNYINTTGDFCTNRTSSRTFDFTDLNRINQTITRANITQLI